MQSGLRKKNKRLIREYLAGKFKKGTIYSQKEVNEILDKYHSFNDYVLLRRELINQGFLSREKDGSKYWRNQGENH